MTEEEKEEPRLYSKGYDNERELPVSSVAPQHIQVDEKLVRWGRWASTKGKRSTSSEVLCSGKGGTPASTAPMAADPQIMAVERAVLRMPQQHADTMRMLYVKRLTPTSICKALHMRYEGWPAWVFACRAMVVNLLRRHHP